MKHSRAASDVHGASIIATFSPENVEELDT
jgi:hypothetical protein